VIVCLNKCWGVDVGRIGLEVKEEGISEQRMHLGVSGGIDTPGF